MRNLCGCRAQLLCERVNQLPILALRAPAKLEHVEDFRLESPYDEPVFQSADHQRMNEGDTEPPGHKFTQSRRYVGNENDPGFDAVVFEHFADTVTDISVRHEAHERDLIEILRLDL